MANLFRQNPLAIALAAIAALLVVVIGVEAALGLWGAPPVPLAKPAVPSDLKMLPPLAAVMPEQAYPETTTRPLFTPTRRPAPAAPAVANTMVKGQYILTGVLALRDQKIALLRDKTSGKVHRVESGKELNGMMLTAVDNEKVKLSQGGDEEVLTLQVQKGPAPPAGPAGAHATGAVTASGPFAPVGNTPGAPGQVPGMPAPVGPAGVPHPQAAPVPGGVPTQQAVAPGSNPGANPAQRSGFGPFANQPSANPSEATPMTPEELLARRRARRGQQQPNQ